MIDNGAIQKLLVECAEMHVLPYYQKLAAHEIEIKNDKSLVTIVDRNAERYLTEKLLEILPGSLVLGEEAYADNKTLMQKAALADFAWIIDPIDGTKNFAKGHPDYAMMIACMAHGEFIGAWIYAPAHGKMAAWVKGDPVTVDGGVVLWDGSIKQAADMNGGEHISYHHLDHKTDIRANREKSFASCISRSCVGIEWIMMLEGELDFISFAPGNPWDVACGAAMVAAMGGSALNLHQQELRGDTLFTLKSAMLATRSKENWQDVRDAMLQDIQWERYFV